MDSRDTGRGECVAAVASILRVDEIVNPPSLHAIVQVLLLVGVPADTRLCKLFAAN